MSGHRLTRLRRCLPPSLLLTSLVIVATAMAAAAPAGLASGRQVPGSADEIVSDLELAVPILGQVSPPPSPPPGARALGFESGDLAGWQLVQRVAEDRIQTVRAPVRQGRQSARFEVRHGDHVNGEQNSRAELGYTTELASEGQEQTYSWSTMLASDYPSAATWQDVVQWKNQGTGSPPLQIKVDGEAIWLQAGSQLNWRKLWSAALVRGEWLDFTIRVKWSSDPAVGWIKLWYRGRQVLQRYRMATLYPGSRNYLKLGLYRDAAVTPTGVVYHDDMRIWAP